MTSSHSACARASVLALSAFALAILPAAGAARAAGEVNIYSYREPSLIKPLLDAFTAKTGIKANVVFAQAGLDDRMQAEGANSPADVLLAVDIGRLADAKAKGISQPVDTAAIKASIEASYRDPEGHWVGVSQRARVIYASKERVKQNQITYEELADPKWKGKICTRSGRHTYNIGLLASLIAHLGEAKAEAWVRGVKANLAKKPAGGDRDQAKAIFAGECDIAIGNTYYMAAMQTNTKSPEQQQWAASIKLLFPNGAGRGTHVNISGAVLAKYAPHKANGVALIEFLASDEGQKIYSGIVNEYPLKAGVAISERVASWGTLKADTLDFDKIATLRAKAADIMDKVGFDAGPGT